MLKRSFVVGALVVSFVFSLSLVDSFADTSDYQTYFFDDHDDGVLTDWTISGSRAWNEADGKVCPAQGSNAEGFLINEYINSDNGTLQVEMTTDQWNGHKGGVILRWTSASSYYFVGVQPGNMYNSSLFFCKNTMDTASGGCEVIASNFDIGTTFTLKIKILGDVFDFYLDGEFQTSKTASDLKTGYLGYGYKIATWDDYVSYNKITWNGTTFRKGDLNGDDIVDLTDLITSLQVTAGQNPAGVSAHGDVDGNTQIGLQESLYILNQLGKSCDTVDVALSSKGASVISSNVSDPGEMIDGITNDSRNFAYVTGVPGDFIVDLGKAYDLCAIGVHLWDGDSRYYQYKVFVSSDNATYTEVIDRSTGENTGYVEDSVKGYSARYVKVQGLYNSVNQDFHIKELKVFPVCSN